MSLHKVIICPTFHEHILEKRAFNKFQPYFDYIIMYCDNIDIFSSQTISHKCIKYVSISALCDTFLYITFLN